MISRLIFTYILYDIGRIINMSERKHKSNKTIYQWFKLHCLEINYLNKIKHLKEIVT